MSIASRLQAHSQEVTIAGRWAVMISVARDATDVPIEVVFKGRDKAAKSGSDVEEMFRDLGVALSRMLQGRDAVTGKSPTGSSVIPVTSPIGLKGRTE